MLQRQDAVHAIDSDYYQPYTRASCATDVIHSPYDDRAIAFPVPPGVDADFMLNQTEYNDSILEIHSFLYTELSRDQILSTPGSIEESRLKWVELPQDPFNGSAIGAVILLPRSVSNSGWGSSLINTSTFNSGTTFTTSMVDPSAVHLNAWLKLPYPADVYGQGESIAEERIVQYDLPFFPEKPVIVTEDWANYLNPFVPALNASVIDSLMSTYKPAAQMSHLDQQVVAKCALTGLLSMNMRTTSVGHRRNLQSPFCLPIASLL